MRKRASLLALVLAAGFLVATPARAEAGPSVPLPDQPATPVTNPGMQSRPPDEATRNALQGNQPPGTPGKDGGGTANATSLAPSATWNVSAQTGEFSWAYPLRVPPAPGGLVPSLALSYSSSAVDGRTSATNNQSSWVGEGWDLGAGFVERTYATCADDGLAGKWDLCWRSDNAIASYPGGGGMLVFQEGKGWRTKSDDGARVERLTAAANGDDDGEHWRITTVNGTQYFFGSRAVANSTWTVPVFGNNTGEPCHAITVCTQAWRWNLDKVVDRHGNVITYQYDVENATYGTANRPYTRAGTLRSIEYGPDTGRVEFTTADRCVPGSECTTARKENWPDVAWTEASYPSPTFWGTKRLAAVTTFVKRPTGFAPVDRWTLEHQFPDPGDGEKPSLWLRSITRQGLPPVILEGTRMPNRVYRVDGLATLNRYRLTGVVSESGGVVSVAYAPPQCDPPATGQEHTNGQRCFPVRWSKRDFTERLDYFHKYVVASVVQSDRFAAMRDQVTSYEYLGGAAWHYDTSEFTKPDKKTWNEFRGFERVRVRTGTADDPAGPIGLTEQRFYRGMHGDKLPSGTRDVKVTDSAGAERTDSDWLSGTNFEAISYNGDSVVSRTLTTPVWQGPTASRGDYHAYIVRPGTAVTHTALTGGAWRTVRKTMTYNDRGQLTGSDDDGERTEIGYAPNEQAWILNLPYRTTTTAPGGEVIVDNTVAYDGQEVGVPPVKGDVTRTASFGVTTSTAVHDAHGRPLETFDALGHRTKIEYTGSPVTKVTTTNPLGHITSETLEPAWGLPVLTVDPNGRRTETAYDALGRTVEVWLPNRKRTSGGGSAKFSYLIRNDAPSVVTTSRINPSGNYTVTKQIHDGLLRPRQTQTPATGGGRVLTDIHYDSQGREFRKTTPYFHNSALDDNLWVPSDVETQGQSVSHYDGAGRMVAQVFKAAGAERWRTTFEHGGDRVHVVPPAGGIEATSVTDAKGRTVELRQGPRADPDVTRYSYTPAGHLATVTDPAGNTWRYTYDNLGRKITSEDVDRGLSTMTYDAGGRLTTLKNSRDITLTYSYDELNRKTLVRQGNTVLAAWTYDTASFGKGLPATASRFQDGNEFKRKINGYNQLNKPLEAEVHIPESEGLLSGVYTLATSYNPDGGAASQTLPAIGDLPAETVNHYYDADGLPTATSGGYGGETFPYVTATSYTRYGEPSRLQYGEDGKRAWQSFYYEESTRRLQRSIVDAEVPNPKQQDVSYAYDPSGNITAADGQCFAYDYMQRLTQVSDCSGTVTAAYTYDKVGNRLTDGRRGYSYTGHRLDTVTQGLTVSRYEYDPTGNTTVRPGQTLAWDAEGHLAKLTDSGGDTTFTYDAEGNRLIRRTPTTSTLYLDGQELTVNRSTGASAATRYYTHGGRTVAVRSGGRLSWLTLDHQGTAQISIDSVDLTVTKRRLTAFGEPRDGAALPGGKGFVGGAIDDTGLTHLGAREYDPALGRFISVDPIMDMADPQQFNGYAYANNSPVTKSDPSGMLWQWLSNLLKTVVKVIQMVMNKVNRRGSSGCDGRPRCANPSGNNTKPSPNTNLCSIVDCRDSRSSSGRRMLLENWLGSNITPKFIGTVNQYAKEAGIDPRLLLAILITESGDSHSGDKSDDRAILGQTVTSVGLANMKTGVFEQTKTWANSTYGRQAIDYSIVDTKGLTSEDNINRSVKAGAYHLAYLNWQLDGGHGRKSSNTHMRRDEMVRIGYNMGYRNMHKVGLLDRRPVGEDYDRVLGDWQEAWRVAGDLLAAGG